MPRIIKIDLNQLAQHVDVKPGDTIVLRGSFHSTNDGSTVGAAITTWPAEAPGGASVDAKGLIDLEGGGFHVVSRDPATHEVQAKATGEAGAACAAFGVASPCLPLRVRKQAQSRLLTDSAWRESLKGGIEVEVITPTAIAAAADTAESAAPWLGVGAAILAVAAVGVLGWRIKKKRAASPEGQMLTLAARVREKLKRADAVVAAPLAPAIDAALRALRERRVDASSTEGKRVMAVLVRVDARLDASVKQARAEEEQQAADELVQEVESALEAIDEANLLAPRMPEDR